MSDTRHARLEPGQANELGWRNLQISSGEEMGGAAPSEQAISLLNLIHISDLHLCDAQSPARFEIADRFADPHHPFSEFIKLVGNYRAQEMMTVQTLETLVSTINQFSDGLFSQRPVDGVVITGDVTDNAQANELSWYLTLLHGGEITPDSGATDRWEGAASKDPARYDRSYWNPEGTPEGCEDDYPRALYGLPTIPGLTDAVRKPFIASGLGHPWFSTHGNHDALLQGTVLADETLREFAIGNRRVSDLPPDLDLRKTMQEYSPVGPARYPSFEGAGFTSITPDSRRTIVEPDDWADLHLRCGHDHGLTETNKVAKTKYWARDFDQVRLISLDTVNANGGWQGSLDRLQFEWLQAELNNPGPKYFVLASHHPLENLFNLYAGHGEAPRVGTEELKSLLLANPRVLLWLAGHNHEHKIELIAGDDQPGFWHIQTASLIDWPQQGRRVEILQEADEVVIATTVFDHQSPHELTEATWDLNQPKNLAGISRILSANHWQRRSGEYDLINGAGQINDRNQILRRRA